MTIEERLARDLGYTDDPCLAVWMLPDGMLINGSVEGLQRDVDHHEIGQYFKRSLFEDPGSSTIYVQKFMRRGNIRYGCSPSGFCAEMARVPTPAQFEQLCRHMIGAWDDRIETCIGRHVSRKSGTQVVYEDFRKFLLYCRKYTDLPANTFLALLD